MNYNKKFLIFISLILFFTMGMIQNFSLQSMIFFWIFILLICLIKNKNHFISLLLILEMLSMSSIFLLLIMTNELFSLNTLFILMTLSVGEAVLGLAILVKLIRWSSSEFLMSGLN